MQSSPPPGARLLLRAPTLLALVAMVVNDHVLKGAGLLPGAVTGKLSDLAFLYLAPIVLSAVTRARGRGALAACVLAPAALFTAINVSPELSARFAGAMSHLVPMKLWPDGEDLVALVVLPVVYAALARASVPPASAPAPGPRAPGGARARRVASGLVTTAAALACMATSPPRPKYAPTHRPIYLRWELFRGEDAVRVLPPRPILRRGKIVLASGHIFLCDPGQGVHVIDNQDPRAPRPVLFIAVPGNLDVAVQDDLLFVDSFVDLLTIRIDLARGTARLVERLRDRFPYDPYQTVTEETAMVLESVDRAQGLVIGFEPLPLPRGAPQP